MSSYDDLGDASGGGARFRTVVEAAPEAIFIQTDGRFAYANPAALRLFGATRSEDLVGTPVEERFHPDFRQLVRGRIRDLNEGRQPVAELDEVVLTMDGEPRHASVSAVPFVHEGKPGALVFARDTTERTRTLERLRESENRFRLLANATNDAMWDWDIDSDTVWLSDGFFTTYGYRRDEIDLTARWWLGQIHAEDRISVETKLNEAIGDRGASWTGNYRFLRRDGTTAWVLDRGYVIRDSNGRAIRMIGGMTDVTEDREREKTLREQAALLDGARDAIVVRDLEHRVLYWNDSAERMYGWTAEEAAGNLVTSLVYGDPTAFLEAFATTLQQGEFVGELDQVTRSGTPLVVEARWTLVRDESGRPTSIFSINTDITERRKLEQQFLRAQRMESIGTLAGGIAHDLNNLLMPITMGVELLRNGPLDEKRARVVENIDRSAKRGADLVRQVLSFARGVEVDRVSLDLRYVIREVEAIMRSTFPRNIALHVDLPDDLSNVIGNSTQLNQVLMNLCVNARDAMPGGGSLTLTARNQDVDTQHAAMSPSVEAGPHVVVEVTDTGCGMTPDVVEHIFDPFFTTKEIGRGTGLGLSTAVGIVRNHRGALSVYSEEGKGSAFKIYLPADVARASPTEPANVDVLPHGNGELILVVDDESTILDITRQTLEAFGFHVLTAEDGAQAIALYTTRKDEIAVVLTDMMMPVMDGAALIAALRRVNPDVRIIASSGLGPDSRTGATSSTTRVRHFLQKPYSAETILRALRTALEDRAHEGVDD